MSSVPPTTGATGATTSSSVSNPAAILGQDGFLQLLVAEMQNQDPLSSSQDPTQSVTQMAQFSSVEQLTNLVQSSQQAQSISLIGHTVAYTDSDGNAGSGVVDAVTFNSGSPVIDVSGVAIDPSQIVGVS
jgi:flagellar basal-body rod modification protein FlgD